MNENTATLIRNAIAFTLISEEVAQTGHLPNIPMLNRKVEKLFEIYSKSLPQDEDEDEDEYDDFDDDVDESNYDPYSGCDIFEIDEMF